MATLGPAARGTAGPNRGANYVAAPRFGRRTVDSTIVFVARVCRLSRADPAGSWKTSSGDLNKATSVLSENWENGGQPTASRDFLIQMVFN